jgi:hypothetical protein
MFVLLTLHGPKASKTKNQSIILSSHKKATLRAGSNDRAVSIAASKEYKFQV